MNQWAFVIAAYAVTIIAVAALVIWAWLSCREAEDAAERLGRRQ